MKQPKRPTRRIKKLMSYLRIDPMMWEVATYDTHTVTIRHKFSGRTQMILYNAAGRVSA